MSGNGESNEKCYYYDDLIKDVYFNTEYGYSTDNGVFKGNDLVIDILGKMKADKDISIDDFISFMRYMKEEGIYYYEEE